MRVNTQTLQKIQQICKTMSLGVSKAKDYASLGLSGRQWLASFVICLMLMPIFSLPVGATVYMPKADPNIAQFELVNAELPIWEKLKINLSAKYEEWTTPMREVNVIHDENDKKKKSADETTSDSDKKNSKKKNGKIKNVEENESKITDDSNNSVVSNAPKTKEPEVKIENEVATDNTENKTEKDKLSKEISLPTENKSQKSLPSALSSNVLPAKTNMYFSAIESADRPILNDSELPVLVSPQNNLGSPMGQTEASAPVGAAATSTRERSGIGNFSFGFPITSLPGRGINAGVGISYNSQLWTKSTNKFTYNIDGNWLAPGFHLGYGYLDLYSNGNVPASTFILTEADGTRRSLTYVSGDGTYTKYVFQSTDGSFTKIEFWGYYYDMILTYSDGTIVYFSPPNAQNRRFPKKIVDVQGNYITIEYLTDDEVGKISKITDTLGREIIFHYDSSEKLLAVSVPGINNAARVQVARFYYQTLSLQTTNRFDGTIDAPESVSVLKYIYMPGTGSGYKYDYSSYYGMIYKITQLRGMQVSTMDTSQMGSVSNETSYTEAAWTRYNYPGTDVELPSPTLTETPKYNKRTDDWIGRPGTTAPETLYSVSEGTNTQTSEITTPDNTTTVSISNKKPGQWDDGLIKETYVTSPGRTIPWSKTIYTWQQGQSTYGRRDPRLEKLETINEAGQAKAQTFEYDIYNNQTKITEHDYAASGQVGTELRRTEITYQTSGTNNPWVARNLINLPTSMKTIVNNVVVSRTDYEYDNYQNQPLANTPGVIKHEAAYDPFTTETRQVRGACKTTYTPPGGHGSYCIEYYINTVPAYNSATDYRGNVTKVTSFADATNSNDPNKHVTTIKFDITGNVVEASLSCCNVKTIEYSSANQYAYPTKETKGSSVQLASQAEYDFYTGLVTKTIDANNQEMNYEYESDTFQRKKIIYPNGAYTLTENSDKLAPGTVPGFIRTTTTLDTNKTAQSYSYYDGRGLGIRSATQTPDGWSVTAVEYDNLGRPVKSYNPFYSATPNGAIPGGTKYTEVVNYDALGRTTSVRLQDLTTVSTSFSDQTTTPTGFNKTYVTVTDQAGKQRRQLTDALGRIVRVDEPDVITNNLGAVDSPTQPTSYEYDGNDNLSKVIQTDGTAVQERKFKYDSLSRLTREKQVEATATLDNDGVYGSSDPNKWTKVLKYNTDGLLTEGTDARGVKTTFAYDGLNRVQSVSFSDDTPKVNYIYDQARTGFFNKGTLTKIETVQNPSNPRPDTPDTATEFDYDLMGRLKAHRQTIGTQTYNLEYSYNLAGQLTSEKYPSGRVVSMNYDANGRLAGIADASRTYADNFQFQGNGTALSGFNLGNGTNQMFSYNDRLQMENQILAKNAEILQKYNYNYGQTDANGILKNNGKLAQVESFIGSQKQWTQKFSYDAIGRLEKAEEFRGDTNALSYAQKFDYDNFGNLYRKQANNPTGQQNPLPTSWIEDSGISKQTNRLTANTSYDDAGNVIQDTKFRNLNYSYDANGRMYKTSNISGTNQSNTVYDANGSRVATQVDGVWTFFIYDALGKMIAEYGGLHATDEGGVKYVLQDWQGSSRAVIGQTGVIKARMDYTAFGEEIQAGIGLRTSTQGFNVSSNLEQKYSRTERDKATGLDHTWFRKLENQAGRWTSPDPYNGSASLGNPQSFNRYNYVENQPTNFIDPSGLNLEAPGSGGYCIRYHYTNGVIGFWGSWTCYPGSSGGGGGGGGGGASNSSQKKSGNCDFPDYDKLTDAQKSVLGNNASNYTNLNDREKANFLNITGAAAAAGVDLRGIEANFAGGETDRLIFSGDNAGLLRTAFENAPAGDFNNSPPSGLSHPGQSDWGGRQSVGRNSLQIGGGRGTGGTASAFIDIDYFNPGRGIFNLLGHAGEVIYNRFGNETNPYRIGKGLGKAVTGYSCKKVNPRE